jgi:hypothetical protein
VKGRFSSDLNGHSDKGRRPGNPNSTRTVFDRQHESKRRRTQETPIPGPSTLSKQGPLDKSIDLTNDDTEPVSRSSMVTDDSEDSLNLGAEKRSRARVAGDGHATQRLRAGSRGGKPPEVLNSDTEIEPIEEFPPQPRKGVVQTIVRNIERNNVPKLQLNSDNPLNLLPLANRKLKVGPLTEEEGRRLTRSLPAKVYRLSHQAHAVYKWFQRQGESFA